MKILPWPNFVAAGKKCPLHTVIFSVNYADTHSTVINITVCYSFMLPTYKNTHIKFIFFVQLNLIRLQ